MGESVSKEIGRIGKDAVNIGKSALSNPLTFFNPALGIGLAVAGQLGGGGGSNAPGINTPPPVGASPSLSSESVQDALALAKLKRNTKSGRAGTIRTSPQGVKRSDNQPKELLGA